MIEGRKVMPRIEPKDWLPATFTRSKDLTDLLRYPTVNYHQLSATEKDQIRQTQILAGEVVRLLGNHDIHSLLMKFDGTVGWTFTGNLQTYVNAKEFPPLPQERVTPNDFLSRWKGVPYIWGGVTQNGIDCSGLTQRYFYEVHGRVIPKNSRDQRRSGRSKSIEAISDHDLVFCYRKTGNRVHHVGIFFDSAIWHARLVEGVVRQTMDEFLSIYQVEEVMSLLPFKGTGSS